MDLPFVFSRRTIILTLHSLVSRTVAIGIVLGNFYRGTHAAYAFIKATFSVVGPVACYPITILFGDLWIAIAFCRVWFCITLI